MHIESLTYSIFFILYILSIIYCSKSSKKINESFDLDHYILFSYFAITILFINIFSLLNIRFSYPSMEAEHILKELFTEESTARMLNSISLIVITFIITLHRFKVLNQQNKELQDRIFDADKKQSERDERLIRAQAISNFSSIEEYVSKISEDISSNQMYPISSTYKIFSGIFNDPASGDYSISNRLANSLGTIKRTLDQLYSTKEPHTQGRAETGAIATIRYFHDQLGLDPAVISDYDMPTLHELITRTCKLILEIAISSPIDSASKDSFEKILCHSQSEFNSFDSLQYPYEGIIS